MLRRPEVLDHGDTVDVDDRDEVVPVLLEHLLIEWVLLDVAELD
jgi:hypothetical protein